MLKSSSELRPTIELYNSVRLHLMPMYQISVSASKWAKVVVHADQKHLKCKVGFVLWVKAAITAGNSAVRSYCEN